LCGCSSPRLSSLSKIGAIIAQVCTHGGGTAIRYPPRLNKKTQYKKTMKVLLLAVAQGGEND
jgi:hypothetical protein